MRFVTDQDAVANVDTIPRQLVHLGEQRVWIDDDAVADYAGDARMQDARRDEAKNEFGEVDVHGVAGVVPTLIPRDDGKVRRQKIDNLPFAFITPLSAKDG